jgi:PPM family protein phosphatase
MNETLTLDAPEIATIDDHSSSPDTDHAPPPERDPKDHVENWAGCNLAGVSDKGLKHEDNQDAMALATVEILVSPIDVPPIYIAVVCDGVSSSDSGAVASATAAKTVAVMLQRALNRNPDANLRAEMKAAIALASKAVDAIECTPGNEKNPPATTIVAAVVRDSTATIAWIGDSRAYWVGETEEGLLTRDDSWCNAMIDAGRMTEEQALESANQHALFRCLGGESGDNEPPVPSFTTFCLTAGTRLLLCSDGFWNYAPGPDEVARLVRQTPPDDPLRTAKHLVNYAIVSGGHDNITVTILAS